MRGGVSKHPDFSDGIYQSSPRAWGCFHDQIRGGLLCPVFPTCVGVFPPWAGRPAPRPRSSPRAWGCFLVHSWYTGRHRVFPTCVGVFRGRRGRGAHQAGLPHVRGGVSSVEGLKVTPQGSSPRAWGCFRRSGVTSRTQSVFPTCVGVFPPPHFFTPRIESLPHVRGGVSIWQSRFYRSTRSSPRAWGCFSVLRILVPLVNRLPHVRGGVSPASS